MNDNNKENLIINKLKNLKNVATLMKEYFMPFDEFIAQKKYTVNEAINAKDSLKLYLNRYGAFMIENTIKDIQNIISQLPLS